MYPSTNHAMRRAIAARQLSLPFTDDNPMDDTLPSCTIANLRTPKLRRCVHDLSSVIFSPSSLNKPSLQPPDPSRSPRIDGGLDGFNFKIRFEKGGPAYVMKVLWDTKHPYPHYYAAQRECQNAALFQMLKAAVYTTNDTAQPGPILIHPDPKTYEDARANLAAFCDEKRSERAAQLAAGATFPNLVPVTEMPRMRRCYGWMRFRGKELCDRLPRGRSPTVQLDRKRRRELEDDLEYTAIIYEFIEDGTNEPDACQLVLDFLWRAGFVITPAAYDWNWQSSILLDHSEVVHCVAYGWRESRYLNKTWSQILEDSRPKAPP